MYQDNQVSFNLIADLCRQYLANKPTKQYRFKINGSGCRALVQQLPIAVFKIAVYICLFAIQQKQSYRTFMLISLVLMVTASHNPPTDNGIKIGKIGHSILEQNVYQIINNGLNSQQNFLLFLQNKLQNIKIQQSMQFCLFLGGDCRQSTQKLKQIIKDISKILKINLIDIGRCSTPECWSLSQYIQHRKIQEKISMKTVELLRKRYVQQVMEAFQFSYKSIIMKKTNYDKTQVLFDFANGSGAISYQPYHERLSQYFNITKINFQDFMHPNFQCGAPYFQKNWNLVSDKRYEVYDVCAFYDGDSDRILLKIKNIQQCFDGNYLAILFLRYLQKLFEQMDKLIYEQLCSLIGQQIKPVVIINKSINNGLKRALNNQQLYISQIGMHFVVQKAINFNISVYFQPNGHGGIYFSQQIKSALNQLAKKYPEQSSIILLQNTELILRNNSRGYALHNFMIFILASNYLYKNHADPNMFSLYKPFYVLKKSIYPKQQNCMDYKNQNNTRVLVQPANIRLSINQLRQKYNQYIINVHKSETEHNLIRIQVQGQVQQICKKLLKEVEQFFNNYQNK